MRERLELAREAYAEAREEGQGHVSVVLEALVQVCTCGGAELYWPPFPIVFPSATALAAADSFWL